MPGESRADERPACMRDGMEVTLLDGNDDLEVVGESYYQEKSRTTRRICGTWWDRAAVMNGYATTSTRCWSPRMTIPMTLTRWRSGCRA